MFSDAAHFSMCTEVLSPCMSILRAEQLVAINSVVSASLPPGCVSTKLVHPILQSGLASSEGALCGSAGVTAPGGKHTHHNTHTPPRVVPSTKDPKNIEWLLLCCSCSLYNPWLFARPGRPPGAHSAALRPFTPSAKQALLQLAQELLHDRHTLTAVHAPEKYVLRSKCAADKSWRGTRGRPGRDGLFERGGQSRDAARLCCRRTMARAGSRDSIELTWFKYCGWAGEGGGGKRMRA